MIVDHVNLPVSDLVVSRRFYEAVLAPFGRRVVMAGDEAVGFGRETWEFGVVAVAGRIEPIHLAFAAPTPACVDSFLAAGLAAGGVSNGAPGPRPRYGEAYYAAYLIDPDGHKVEAVARVTAAS